MPIVEGNVPHDSIDSGNPLSQGLSAQDNFTLISFVAVNDRVRAIGTLKGAQFVVPFVATRGPVDALANSSSIPAYVDEGDAEQTYRVISLPSGFAPDTGWDRLRTLGDTGGAGLGILAAAPWIPGASDVKSETIIITSTEATRRTLVTPTSGKKIRVLAIMVSLQLTSDTTAEVYFGTAADVDTASTKVVARGTIARNTTNNTAKNLELSLPDGGGRAGAVDEVLSVRMSNDNDYQATVIYREE